MISSTNIHVAISPWDLTDDYNRHAGVTLLSLLDHSSQPITVHLLYDEKLCIGKEKETEYNKKCYQKIANKYGCNLEFHHVELPKWSADLNRVCTFTSGTLLRLYLPELLLNLDKIIYLDCDTIVLTDISKLWDVDLEGKCLAATIDHHITRDLNRYQTYLSKRNISLSKYFNAGVLVLNLSELREMLFTKKVWEYLKNNLDTPYLDQDAINYVCQNNCIELSTNYNTMIYPNENADCLDYFKNKDNDCIMHLIGKPKPWEEYSHPYNNIYWEYLRETPWCEDVDVFYAHLRSAPDFSKALSILERNFFAHLHGTRWQKIRYSAYFGLCILKSFINGMWKTRTK